MSNKTWKFSVYLLQNGTMPEDAFSKKVNLRDYTDSNLTGAKIAIGSSIPYIPKWVELFELTAEETDQLETKSSYCVLLLSAENRWFAITWGLGHTKLNNDKIVQDFGRRVMPFAVDPEKVKSMDSRSFSVNALSQRSQIARASNQTAFDIDTRCNILLALSGRPNDKSFANTIHGATALTITRKANLTNLPELCRRALEFYASEVYPGPFSWMNNLTPICDPVLLEELRNKLLQTLTNALQPRAKTPDYLMLAYPIIYDPECGTSVKFRGYSSRESYPDLEIDYYLTDLRGKNHTEFNADMLERYKVQEWDENRGTPGREWKIENCLIFQTNHDDNCYMFFYGCWYRIANELVKNAENYFDSTRKVTLPQANVGDNEVKYNKRLAADTSKMLCLDGKLVTPTDAKSPIELCDFLGKKKWFIHIKDKTGSSTLSHLLNQGYVSALTLMNDAPFRDSVRSMISKQLGGSSYAEVIPGKDESFIPSNYTVVFGVLVKSSAQDRRKLPFFSLMTFQQTRLNIEKMGYKVAFAWIKKEGVTMGNDVVKVGITAAPTQITAAPAQTTATKRPILESNHETSNQFRGYEGAQGWKKIKLSDFLNCNGRRNAHNTYKSQVNLRGVALRN